MANYLQVLGQIEKNIYTLAFVQFKKRQWEEYLEENPDYEESKVLNTLEKEMQEDLAFLTASQKEDYDISSPASRKEMINRNSKVQNVNEIKATEKELTPSKKSSDILDHIVAGVTEKKINDLIEEEWLVGSRDRDRDKNSIDELLAASSEKSIRLD